MRGQSSPEVGRVTFEQSTDGIIWTGLGNGTRIIGGWQLTGLSLPFNQNHYVRARGYATGGLFNSSGSLFESVRMFYLKPIGPIVDFDGDVKMDVAVYHSASGLWFIRPSSGAADYYVGYGGPDYTPVPGDYDGDAKTDVAVYHPPSGLWFIKPSSGAADYYVGYGGTGYVPVPGTLTGMERRMWPFIVRPQDSGM